MLRALVLDVGDSLRRVVDLADTGRQALEEPLGELRERRPVLAIGPVRHAAEAAHALRHVGLKADPALFAIVDLVDADLHLLVEDVGDARLDGLFQRGGLNRLAGFLVDQHAPERFAPRQTAGMGHEDAGLTRLRFRIGCTTTAR
jgi:hypothetical protein